MLEFFFIGCFAVGLLSCVIANISIIYALLFGYILFFCYGIKKNFSPKQIVSFSFSGIKTIKNILLTFILIGVITAVWRSCGTIAYIVYHATEFCNPSFMVLLDFLLCCFISFLTGTAFGSAATIGTICMIMSNSMGISPLYSGGAILAGVFFGDRCSPMSTSALLVSTLTKTNLFNNLTFMFKTCWLPFLLSCGIYILLGFFSSPTSNTIVIQNQLDINYNLSIITVIPAVTILILSFFKINVKITLLASILMGSFLTIYLQNMNLFLLFKTIVFGFFPENQELFQIMSGGGILSMIKVLFIVCVSSCYAGIFAGTHFLSKIQTYIQIISLKITSFGTVLFTSLLTNAIACNQTLAIMLTHQICDPIFHNKQKLAIYLENTVVIIAPLIPWSIAGATPLDSIGAPITCLITAFYLYLLPLWNFFIAWHKEKKNRKVIPK